MKEAPAIALVLPPLGQLNAPYPSTAYLARHLRSCGVACTQRDLGIELALRLYSRAGLAEVFDALEARDDVPDAAWRALALRRQHEGCIDAVIAFLQRRDGTVAPRILDTPFLPRTPRLLEPDLDGFGPLGVDDTARHLATLYLSDLADLVALVDPDFALSRYGHRLAVGAHSFDAIAARLDATTLVDRHVDALADTLVAPVVGISIPFPGQLLAALRIGRRLRARGTYVVVGGGYVNTELRTFTDLRPWQCFDALCLDDGEGPLHAILAHRAGGPDRRHRTRTREGFHDPPHADVPPSFAAWYGDLDLSPYLQLVDGPNPAHRLWSDGRWNKVTAAHGCYWRRCTFCDVKLPYVGDYAPTQASRLVDAMVELARDTGQRGFHFVDEAAPPRVLFEVAQELLARGESLTWWGNIRFEESFTPDRCRLLAASGCIAVTGGLEVGADRVLARIDKGVTVDQVARVAAAFTGAGVLVHAYLMHGFPGQTLEEEIDAMEVARQLFAVGAIRSAFWHRFVLTRHSLVFQDPAAFGIEVDPTPPPFAANDVAHRDPLGPVHDACDAPLDAALHAWMRGRDLDAPLQRWFSFPVPAPSVPADLVARATGGEPGPLAGRLLWLGGDPLERDGALVVSGVDGEVLVRASRGSIEWLGALLLACRPGQEEVAAGEVVVPGDLAAAWGRVRRAGLVGV